jgi:hypothetical protein
MRHSHYTVLVHTIEGRFYGEYLTDIHGWDTERLKLQVDLVLNALDDTMHGTAYIAFNCKKCLEASLFCVME